MKHYPYIFPVEAWQYPGEAEYAGTPAWTLPYLCFVKADGLLYVGKPHDEMLLELGDWLVRFPTGDLAAFPDDSFKGLFSQPVREPHHTIPEANEVA